MTENKATITWEEATAKPTFMPQKLLRAMVGWRNDKLPDQGLAVGLGQLEGEADLEEQLKTVFNAYKREWDESSPAECRKMLADYMRQIKEAAANEDKHSFSTPYTLILIVNMMWLVSAGMAVNDEYNGTQFFWAGKGEPPWRGEGERSIKMQVKMPDWPRRNCGKSSSPWRRPSRRS